MLSPEQRERLQSMLGATDDVDEPESQTPESTQETSQSSSQAPTKVEAEVVPKAEPQGKRELPPVPYDRFREVNASKKQALERVKELEAQLAARSERSILDHLAGDQEPQYSNLPPEVQARLEALELEEGTRKLDRELARIERDHPEVDQEWLVKAIASGAEIEDAVAFYSQVYQTAASRLPQVQTQAKTPPAVPPAVRSVSPTQKPVVRPQNMEQAHAAFRKLLRS